MIHSKYIHTNISNKLHASLTINLLCIIKFNLYWFRSLFFKSKFIPICVLFFLLSFLLTHNVYSQITIHTEGFESWSGNTPTGWSNSNTSFCIKSAYYPASGKASQEEYDGSSYSAVRFNSYGNSNGTTANLTSPVIDLSAYSNCEISFRFQNSNGSDNVELRLYNGSSWSTVGTYTTASWAEKTYTIPASYQVSGFKYRFKGESDYGYSDMYIDAVIITGNVAGPSITYSSSTYCSTDSDPTPTLSGNAGVGTYSSTTGLSINSSSGTIDLSASSPGSYTVTYTDTDSQTATFDVGVSENTFYVSTTGSDSNNGLSTGTAFATIQKAIDVSNSSCGTLTVYVADGTYNENNIDIDVPINIIGESESGTIIDNNDVSGEYCFQVTADNADVKLQNITIRDFKGDAGCAFRSYQHDNKIVFDAVTINSCYILSSATYDAAVFIYHDTGASTSDSIVMKNCTFSDNYSAAADYGTALFVGSYSYDYDYPVLISNCIFDNNDSNGSSYSYGACNIDRGYSAEVTKCVFKNNTGHGYNSGLRLEHIGSSSGITGRTIVENCLFHDNSLSFAGAAMGFEYAKGTLTNCTFAQNSNTNGSSYYVSNLDIGSSTITVKNCIFQSDDSGNEMISGGTISYSNIYGGSGGDSYTDGGNNLSSDPDFTNAGSNDFTLASTSPCIDTGTATGAPSDDLAGNSRDGSPDIGAYELAMNTWDGSSSSDWKTAANWSDNSVPTTESVVIPTSGSYTNPPIIDEADAVCGSITLQGDAVLTLSSGKLTATGSVAMASTSEIQFDGGELECSGKFSADGILDINSGTLDVDGEFEVGSTLSEQISGGTIEVEGDFDGASEGDGDFTPTGGTVVLNGSSATTVDNHASATFYNLTLDQAGVKSSSGSITVSNDFTINSGSQLTQSANRLTLAGNVDISGTLNHSGGNDIYLTGSSKTLSGTGTQTTANYFLETGSNYNLTDDWSINSLETWTGGATLSVATTKTLTLASTFYTRTNANITLTGSANMTIGGNAWMAAEAGAVFNLNSGVLDLNGANAHLCGGSSTFNANSGTINISSANSTISGTFNEGTSTVNFDGSAQNVPAETYSNLTISNAGTKTAGGNIDVDGDLTTAATATCKLDLGAYNLELAGDLTVGATDGLDASDASCTVTFDGSTDQSISHAGNSAASLGATVTEGFESGSGSWSVDNSGSFDWTRQSGSTGSSGTGPSGAYAGSWYYYTEATSGSTGDDDYITQTFDFSSYINPQMTYYYHMYGAAMGTLYIEVNTGGGWSAIQTISGEQHGSEGAAWTLSTVDLSSYAGNAATQIRFHGERGTNYTSDMAIDAVEISDLGPTPTGSEFNDLTISKSGGDLILSSTLEIEGTITMTSGDINLNGNNIDLGSTGEISGETNSSRIFGTSGVITTTRTINAPTALDAGGLGLAITSSANFGSTTIFRSHVAQTGDGNTSIERYYSISPTTNTGLDATIVMSYFDNELGTHNEADLALYRSTDGGTTWTWRGGTVDEAANTITLNEIDAFSLWAPSDGVVQPLPVNMVTFYGEKQQKNNILKWTTASEKNNDYFTIEKTTDGKEFYEVGRIEGAGNSIYYNSYSLTDANVEQVLNYYRLVQTDFDGKKEYSNLITIDNRGSQETERTLIQITNTWGQEVTEEYSGVVIYIYSDGSIERVFQN